ncbi:hypothetical protein AAG906_010458 [Vitis piasezkii]
MEATQRIACNADLINPLFTMGIQVSCVLVLSHFFHLVLKPLGQPGPIAQILAGVVIGPSALSKIGVVKKTFHSSSEDYYQILGLFSRIFFMFLIGLQLDLPYAMRNMRRVGTVALGGAITCSVFGAAVSLFLYDVLEIKGSKFLFALALMIIITNAASPVAIRLAVDYKLATSDVGRLVISSSLINDICCALLVCLMSIFSAASSKIGGKIRNGFLCLILLGVVVILNKHLSLWLNKRNRNLKHLKNTEFFCVLSLIVATAMFIEWSGYSSIVSCFLMGMMYPREGKTARTLMHKLSYSIHTFVLPVYFGYTGFQVDLGHLKSLENAEIVGAIVLLSIGGKITGTLGACRSLNIPVTQGVVLAFLLNVKGNVDLVLVGSAVQNYKWSAKANNLLLITIMINTVIVGPVVALIVSRETKSFGYCHVPFERQDPERELRILACVHGPRHVPTMARIIQSSNGAQSTPISPFLMHLIELPEKTKTNLMYNQLQDDELSDDDDYGGNDVVEINDIVDAFFAETGIMTRQLKVVSPFATMYEEVCNGAEDLRASIILLPFHKHQRIDGKMESGKEGVRITNQKVLRHATCTVAILVDRVPQHVAILFFGGPDDREALAYGRSMGMHPHVNLTVIRFLPESSKDHDAGMRIASYRDEVLMSIPGRENENEEDNAFLANFYNRYVTSGRVGYVEKYVDNGEQTVNALRQMGDMYSLFIVGKGGRGQCPITIGMSDWEECPELGTVGDLLASADFDGSVLVIQQHRHQKIELIED